ncbi:AMP-binding protein [Streptomyces eurocidicus]|uniref:Non-ribosomal peptide synthetase component F n=1 Tax=Streptomyces eurocidicus TaxID=66423 RepID=A0A7W8B9C6_STREU|nr:AMP-binding protein [Streptomyces eurocidicus]MBB5119197.1 non-ribosomal peptide synthetase component F [Streptomyces eurocidicus]MBF6056305.1 AMP-binding protein [Streptomyces eurocidicus]
MSVPTLPAPTATAPPGPYAPPVAPSPADTVHGTVERWAAAFPHRTAVRAHDATLTYAALDQRANHLAHRLRALGVREGDTVAVCLEPSARQVTALLAVLKAGGAYLALGPGEHPRGGDRAALLHNTGARAVITQELFAGEWNERIHTLLVGPSTLPAPRGAVPPATEVPAHGPAYVLPVTGPASAPWGVCVPHRALTALAEDARFLPVRPGDVALSAYGPDGGSALGLWAPLMAGAQLLVAPRGLGPRELATLIREERVTVARLGAPAFREMAKEGLVALKGLRCLVVTTASLSSEELSAVRRELPKVSLVETVTL